MSVEDCQKRISNAIQSDDWKWLPGMQLISKHPLYPGKFVIVDAGVEPTVVQSLAFRIMSPAKATALSEFNEGPSWVIAPDISHAGTVELIKELPPNLTKDTLLTKMSKKASWMALDVALKSLCGEV